MEFGAQHESFPVSCLNKRIVTLDGQLFLQRLRVSLLIFGVGGVTKEILIVLFIQLTLLAISRVFVRIELRHLWLWRWHHQFPLILRRDRTLVLLSKHGVRPHRLGFLEVGAHFVLEDR